MHAAPYWAAEEKGLCISSLEGTKVLSRDAVKSGDLAEGRLIGRKPAVMS